MPPAQDRIAALIPCYHARPYIREAVLSLLQQTLPPDLIVLLDDASGDGFEDEVQDLLAKHKNILIHRNPHNLGVSACRNEGLKNYPADYYILLDADDISMPQRIEKSITLMRQNPQCGIVGSYIYFINVQGKILKEGTHFYCLTHEDSQRERASLHPTGLLPSTVCLRGDVVHKDGLLFEAGLVACEDIELWARVLEADWDILTIPEPLIGYRMHPDSICSQQAALVYHHMRYVKENVRRRRSHLPTITYPEYQAEFASLPLCKRSSITYSIKAESLYRHAGVHFMNRNYLRGSLMMFTALLMQPQRLAKLVYHLKQVINHTPHHP